MHDIHVPHAVAEADGMYYIHARVRIHRAHDFHGIHVMYDVHRTYGIHAIVEFMFAIWYVRFMGENTKQQKHHIYESHELNDNETRQW